MKPILLVLAAGAMLGGLATRLSATPPPQEDCTYTVYDPTDPNSPPPDHECSCNAEAGP